MGHCIEAEEKPGSGKKGRGEVAAPGRGVVATKVLVGTSYLEALTMVKRLSLSAILHNRILFPDATQVQMLQAPSIEPHAMQRFASTNSAFHIWHHPCKRT